MTEEEEEEEPATAESSATTSPPVFRLRPGASELLGFTLAVATAKGAAVATNLDVVLASLARFTLTKLDKHELEGAASTALVHILPEPQTQRIGSALSVIGVNFPTLASHPDVTREEPRLASIVRDAYALVDRLHGKDVWSHHLVALALAGDPLPPEVLDALGVSQDQMRAALRSTIARRWPTEPSEVWNSILGQEGPEKHGDTAVNGADPPANQVVTEDLSEFSDSIRKAVASIGSAEVTASAFAEEIRKLHPEYAGGRFGSLKLNVNAGDQRPLGEWLSLVRAQYDLKTVAESRHKVIDGHLALAALAAVDAPLSDQIDEATLAALEGESEVKPHGPPAREHVRWLFDDPVGLDGDELGRRGVASALEDQLRAIVRDFSGRSFLVHIDGPWGAGKSTLLRFLHESVDRYTGPDRWLVVSYDSWRQSRVGPPWLTLLQAVRTVVRSAQPHIWDRGWFWLRERARLVNSWQWITLFLMVVAATTLAALLIDGDIHLTLSNWGDIIKLVGGLVPVVGAFWLIAKSAGRFVSLDSRRSARTFLETRADPMEDLAAHFYWLLCMARSPVLLLIDDLDRCPEAFVVDLLDAVQKLMRDSMPDANSRSGERKPTLLVVVAADGRWVRNSYDNAYASLAHAVNEPGATVGTLFLEKLFQLTVPVPGLSDELKAEYLRDLLAERPARPVGREADPNLMRRLSEATHDQVLDVLADAPAIERVRASSLAIEKLVVRPDAQQSTRHALEPYAALLDPTPRAMKRFVMAYSMLRAVRTAEGSVVGIGPLALWTILQTRWPMLANYLQASPEAVRLFQVSADRIPGSTPVELAPLFTDPPNELRAVMNHPDGPMNAQTIRESSGQALSH